MLRKLGRAVLLGGLGGLFAAALDELMAALALGHWVGSGPEHLAVYCVAGAGFGGLLAAGTGGLRLPSLSGAHLFAGSSVLVYSVTVFERLGSVALARLAFAPALLVTAIAGAGGLTAFILILRRILQGGGESLFATPVAMVLTSFAVALGYAVNHNVMLRMSDPMALVADAAMVAAALLLACSIRVLGLRRVGAILLIAVPLFAVVRMRPVAGQQATSLLSTEPRPHLILVIIDTLRYDTFESVVASTPEGRSFQAALGPAAWFDQAIAAGPWTAPSVASILTGLYPPEHGVGSSWNLEESQTHGRLPDAVVPLAEQLQEHGYRAEGLVTNAVLHPVWGLGRGFEHYELLPSPAEILPLLNVLTRAGLLERDFYQPAAAVTRRLAQRLNRADSSAHPYFFWLHLTDPHYPMRAHDDLAPERLSDHPTEWERLYRQEVRYTLREVARMIELFKEHGFWDDAVFVLVSDHGEMFESDGHVVQAPGREAVSAGHGHSLYGEVMRVPLVIRPAGGLAALRRIDALVSHTDLHDTMLDLLGVDGARVGADRVSLAPWLEPKPPLDPERRAHTLMTVNMPRLAPAQRGLRTESLSYIEYANGELPEELYDLREDDRELHNLAVPGRKEPRLGEIRHLLDLLWSRLEVAEDSGVAVDIDDQTRERLRGLGYID